MSDHRPDDLGDDDANRTANETAADGPAIEELLAIVEQLDADNEHLRMKVLDLMRVMEDAVTAQVAAERERDDLQARLDAALAAIEGSRTLALTEPLRVLARRAGRLVGRDRAPGDERGEPPGATPGDPAPDAEGDRR